MGKIMYMDEEYAGYPNAQLNGIDLIGNKTSEQVNVVDMTDPELNISTHAGTSSTEAGTTTKVVTTKTADFTLTTDAYVVVRFTNATTTSASLNVDGTGSKTAYYNNTRIGSSNSWAAGETCIFQYNGTRYNRVDYADTLPVDVRLAYHTMMLGWEDTLS